MTAELVTTLSTPPAEPRFAEAESTGGLCRALFRPVDSTFLAGFRVLYGLTMLARAWYYVAPSETGAWFDKTYEYYLSPDIHFSYYGFEWVHVLPDRWMCAFFVGMMLVSACVTLGFCYRITSVLLSAGYVYAFAIDKALFLNHYYLLCLISFLMCLVPAQCVLSLDARIRPSVRSDVVPAWTLWLLRAQIAIPYFFGGIAKLNSDWLHGEPMRKWLHFGSMGFGREYLHNEVAVAFVTFGGLLFDLSIVPLLLWRRTRVAAFLGGVLIFNLCNSQLFRIGVFPWFMLFGSMLFFPPEWHRRMLTTIFPISPGCPRPEIGTSALFERMCRPSRRVLVPALLAVYFGFQVLWPLRQFLYGGQPAWTGKGDLFAWRMMLYDKTGEVRFFRVDPTQQIAGGTKERIEIPFSAIEKSLNGYQQIMLQRDPDLMLQLSHFLAKRYRNADGTDAEIYVEAKISLNTRKPQWLVDRDMNLAAIERTAFGPTPWIVPFENTPRRRLDLAVHELPLLPSTPPQQSAGEESESPRYSNPEWQ